MEMLKGKVIKEVKGLSIGSEEIEIVFTDGFNLKMMHYQDCCEDVDVCDIDGDAEDIIGNTLIAFKEVTGETTCTEDGDQKYTFYTVETTGGYVWIRWLGASNGYYSIDVSVNIYDQKGNLVN